SDFLPWLTDRPESLALWLDAGTFALSAFLVSGIRIPSPSPTKFKRFEFSKVGHEILDGLRFLRENSLASAMTLGIVAAFGAVGAVLALGPVFATRALDAGKPGWGIL